MDLKHLQQKLIAIARRHPPSERVPFAFEKRIMARLSAVASFDPWAVASRLFWRAAVSCVAVTFLFSVWSLNYQTREAEMDLAQQFENTVFSVMNQDMGDSW